MENYTTVAFHVSSPDSHPSLLIPFALRILSMQLQRVKFAHFWLLFYRHCVREDLFASFALKEIRQGLLLSAL